MPWRPEDRQQVGYSIPPGSLAIGRGRPEGRGQVTTAGPARSPRQPARPASQRQAGGRDGQGDGERDYQEAISSDEATDRPPD